MFAVQDLQLDNPDAAHLLVLFLGRAIVDEALPPSFLAAVLPSLANHSEGVNVVQSTGTTAVLHPFWHVVCHPEMLQGVCGARVLPGCSVCHDLLLHSLAPDMHLLLCYHAAGAGKPE